MARIDIKGVLVPNDYKGYYEYFGEDCTCPMDVQKVLDTLPDEEHEIYINSPGGVIDTGAEIYTMLKSHQPGVKIYIVGEACSAASVVAMAGYSEMSPVALLMVHCVSTGVRGNHATMEHAAEMLKTADKAMCQAYIDKAGMSEEEALSMMEEETWLTAQQALERGLIDKVMFKEEEELTTMVAAVGFQLPTKEQLNKVKKMVGDTPAFLMSEAQTRLNLLRMKGES